MHLTCPACGLPRADDLRPCLACGLTVEHPIEANLSATTPAMNAWQAHAGRGPNKALIGVLLFLPIGFVALTGVAIAVNFDAIVASYETGLADTQRAPQPAGTAGDLVAVGEVVDILDWSDADLGSVTVLRISRSAELLRAGAQGVPLRRGHGRL